MRRFWIALVIGTIVSFLLMHFIIAPPPAHGDVLVVGDSLTCQSFDPGCSVNESTNDWGVNWRNGRRLHQARAVVRDAAVLGPHSLVVALGSNDVASSSQTMGSDIRFVSRFDLDCIVLTTVKVEGVTGFYNRNWVTHAQRWNVWVRQADLILSDADTQVLVADWNSYSRHKRGWFMADGLHLTSWGRVKYRQLLHATAAQCSI